MAGLCRLYARIAEKRPAQGHNSNYDAIEKMGGKLASFPLIYFFPYNEINIILERIKQ